MSRIILLTLAMLASATTFSQTPIVLNTDEVGNIAILGGTLISISGNGRYAMFRARQPLIAEDTSNGGQIYVRDLETGTLELVTVTPNGSPATNGGAVPDSSLSTPRLLSDNGRIALFASDSEDILPGTILPIIGQNLQLYLRDLDAGVTVHVSVDSDNNPANGSVIEYTLDPSGLAVLFSSNATNLDPMFTQPALTYLHRVDAPVGSSVRTQAACRDRDGVARPCNRFSLSCGGALTAFAGGASFPWIEGEDLPPGQIYSDIFIGNTIAGNWKRLGAEVDPPIIPDGTARNGIAPSINCTGDRLAFISLDPLITGDSNGERDLHIYNLLSGQFFLLQNSPGESFGASTVSLSTDGSVVAFLTPNNIDPDDSNFIAFQDAYAIYLPRDIIPPLSAEWISQSNRSGADSTLMVYAGNLAAIGFRALTTGPNWPGNGSPGSSPHLYVQGSPSARIFNSRFQP